MKIIVKYIKNSMLESKARLLLLVFSISISTALLVCCAGTISIIKNVYETSKKATAEGKDLAIVSNTEALFFDTGELDSSMVKNVEGEIRITGVVKDEELRYTTVVGKQTENINTGYIVEGSAANLKADECILSKRISEDLGVKLGENVEISINGEPQNFKVAAISANDGIFYLDKPTQFSMVVNHEYLSDLFGAEGKYNFASAEIVGGTIESTISGYNEKNSDFIAQKLFNEEGITQQVSEMSMGLYVMFAIVVLISILIIYGAFKLTITERLPVIGTFFSQGATHRKVERILLLESIVYGLLGGVVGDILGTLVLFLINYSLSPLAKYGIREPFQMNGIYLVIGFVFAVLLSLVSAIMPVRSVRKLSEKDIILNSTTEKMKNGWVRFIIGVVCMVVSYVTYLSKGAWAEQASMVVFFVGIIGIVLIYKKIVDIVTGVMSKVVKGKGNVAFLAFNNVKTSKVLLDSIILIVVALLCSLIIVTVGDSMNSMIRDAYGDLNYDLSVGHIITVTPEQSTTDAIMDELAQQDIVVADTINPFTNSVGFLDEMETTVNGVIPERFANYNGYLDLHSASNIEAYSKFEQSTGYDMVVSELVLKKINKKVGDKVDLKINDISHEFTIIGAINGKSFNMGNFILVNIEQLKQVLPVSEALYVTFSVNGNVDDAKEKITDLVANYGATCIYRSDDLQANIDSAGTIVSMVSVFSYMAIVISAIGVLNNITIVFLQRKREFAVLSSIGMSRQKRARLLIYESLIVVFLSCAVTVGFASAIIGIFGKVMEFMAVAMTLKLNYGATPIYCIITAIVVLLSTIPVLSKSKKLSIVEELKYE